MATDDRPHALVVDDDALIRLDAMNIIEEAGFRTIEAPHGDAAVMLLEEHHPRIVLLFTDVEMPASPRDGFALARHTSAQWPHIAIVVCSGDVVPEEGHLPEGARFIAKPFNAKTVHSHLLEILPDGKKPEPLSRLAAELRRP